MTNNTRHFLSANHTYLGLLALLEESLLGLPLLALLLGEVVGSGGLFEGLLVDTANIHALARGDHIASVNSSQGDTVDLEGTGNEENTLVEVLEEDNTLATEAAGEEDENRTGLEALTELGGTESLADLFARKKRNDIRLEHNLFQFRPFNKYSHDKNIFPREMQIPS